MHRFHLSPFCLSMLSGGHKERVRIANTQEKGQTCALSHKRKVIQSTLLGNLVVLSTHRRPIAKRCVQRYAIARGGTLSIRDFRTYHE